MTVIPPKPNRQPAGVSTGGQFAPAIRPEAPAVLVARPSGWVRDKTLSPAMEVALSGPLRLADNDARFGSLRLGDSGRGFEVAVEDSDGVEHIAEFTPEGGGIRMELHAGNEARSAVREDIERFSQEDLDCPPQRLAAVLANPENGLDDRIRQSVSDACPTVAGAGQDARDLLDVHPGAVFVVAHRMQAPGASDILHADLLDARRQVVATGAGAGLDAQYADGFEDLADFEVDGPARTYDLEKMSGRPE